MILIPNGRLYVLQRTYLISSFGKFWMSSVGLRLSSKTNVAGHLPRHIFAGATSKISVCEISGRKVSKSSQT